MDFQVKLTQSDTKVSTKFLYELNRQYMENCFANVYYFCCSRANLPKVIKPLPIDLLPGCVH